MLCFHVKVDKSLNGNRFSQKAENVPVQIHICRQLHVKTTDHTNRAAARIKCSSIPFPKHTTEVLYDFAVE